MDGDSDYEVVTKITYAGWRITYAGGRAGGGEGGSEGAADGNGVEMQTM